MQGSQHRIWLTVSKDYTGPCCHCSHTALGNSEGSWLRSVGSLLPSGGVAQHGLAWRKLGDVTSREKKIALGFIASLTTSKIIYSTFQKGRTREGSKSSMVSSSMGG